jgi:membrane protein
VYFGAVLLNVVQPEYEAALGMYRRPDLFFKVWFFCTLGFFMLVLGMILAQSVFDRRCLFKKLQAKMLVQPFLTNRDGFYVRLAIIFFIAIAVLLLLIYRQRLGGKLPIEYIFSGKSAAALALLRSDATNNFQGKLYRYYMFIEDIPLILCILLSFLFRKKRVYKFLFIFLVCYNIFFSLISLQKGPLFNFIILGMIIYFFKTGKINKKLIFYFVLFATGGIVILYIFLMGQKDKSFFSLLLGALHRLFIVQITPFYWYLKYIEDYGFLYGRSFPNPAGFLPFEHFNLSVEIMNYAMGDLGGVVGSMPTVFLAELYVNFGFVCMLLGSCFFGFLLGCLDIFFISRLCKDKNIFIATIYIFLIKYFSKFAGTGGIWSILIDEHFIVSIFMILFLYMLSNTKIVQRVPKYINRCT